VRKTDFTSGRWLKKPVTTSFFFTNDALKRMRKSPFIAKYALNQN